MGTEKAYDEIIAPMLLEVTKKCEQLGMSLVARVEWGDEEAGITQYGATNKSGAQYMTLIAAHSHGNLDKFNMHMIKNCDVSNTLTGEFFSTPQEER